MSCDWQSLHSSIVLHPGGGDCLFFCHCLSSHQSLFTKCLPPSRSLHVPGTKSAQLYLPRRLPRGWPGVLTSRPLPNQLRKLPYEVHGVQIWWARTGELLMHGADAGRVGQPPVGKMATICLPCPSHASFQCPVGLPLQTDLHVIRNNLGMSPPQSDLYTHTFQAPSQNFTVLYPLLS